MGWQPEDTSGDGSASASVNAILPQDHASYIADMTRELRAMANKAGLEFLSYLLAIAEEEARQESQRRRYQS